MNKYYAIFTVGVVLVSGCSTPQGVRNTYPSGEFSSTKSPQELVTCIDRNTDGSYLNTLATSVKPVGDNNFEIVVRNGNSTYAMIEIAPLKSENSVATIRLSGRASLTPKTVMNKMTDGCS